MENKKLVLDELHKSLGAKFAGFAGFDMPVRYSSDLDEHHKVRKSVGVFDVSHMGEFVLRGPGALELIERVISNDATKLTIGKALYAYLPNETGGIVDDLLVYRLGEQHYMLVVNASNIEKDWNHIQSYNNSGVEMSNISADICLFAVQGPCAIAALQPLVSEDLSKIGYYNFIETAVAGIPNVIVSATGYTGAGGFELYVANGYAEQLWHKIFEAGAAYDIAPIGVGARDTLRLEMGYCLYGHEINDTTSPLEAGLGWVTKFTKDFVGRGAIEAQKAAGFTNKLVGFALQERGIARGGYSILNQHSQVIGHVCSGTQSPSLGYGIGLGYVPVVDSKVGTDIQIEVRGKGLAARVVALPFLAK